MADRKEIEGQLNLFDSLIEYTDAQGANVKVQTPETPIRRRGGASDKLKVSDPEPEQLMLVFDEDKDDDLEELILPLKKKEEPKPEPKVEPKPEPKPEPKKAVAKKEEPKKEEPKKEEPKKEEPKKEEPEKEEPKPEESKKSSKAVPKTEAKSGELLFKQCSKCWCRDCVHNSRNEGKPRDIAGVRMACPACEDCIQNGSAEICVIGSAKEGCKTRALEEGIIEEEEIY